jgi:hypothetical protein
MRYLFTAWLGSARHGTERTLLHLMLHNRVSMLQFLYGVNTPQYSEILTAITMIITVFQDVILRSSARKFCFRGCIRYNLVGKYQWLGKGCYLHLQGQISYSAGSIFPWIGGTYLPDYTASHPCRQQLSSVSEKLQVSFCLSRVGMVLTVGYGILSTRDIWWDARTFHVYRIFNWYIFYAFHFNMH